MEEAEKAYSERVRKTSVFFMSLETMFADEQVRALAKAAGRGQVKKIDALVDQGVDVNARGTSNATPLFWAIRKKNLRGVSRLLELGANPNIFSDGGSTVVHAAASYRKYPLLKAVLEHGGDPNLISGGGLRETPLFEINGLVPKTDDVACLDLLVEYGANVNARGFRGFTPAMGFAGLGRFDLAQELIIRGANYRLKNDHGENLLDIIASARDKYIPGSWQEKELIKLIDWLEQRGVSLPE